jgi:hypothetical protein
MKGTLCTLIGLLLWCELDAHAYSPPGDNRVVFWLDAADPATLFQDAERTLPVTSNAQPVGAWADKSGSGWHVTATIGSSGKPGFYTGQQNNLPSIRFDGNSDSLTTHSASLVGSTYTIFAVVRRISARDHESILSIHTSNSVDWNGEHGAAVGFGYGGTIADVRNYAIASESTHPGNGFGFIYASKYDGINNTVYLNGAAASSVASSGSFSAETLTLGARGSQMSDANNYEYFEVLIYNLALSDAARQEVENYLGTKYALPGTQWAPPPPPPPEPPAGVYHPANDTNLGFWVDASDTATLFQDTARTIPVTANGESVAAWVDKGPNGWHLSSTTGNNGRPLYRTAQQNGKPAVRFDGNSDSLSALNASITGSSATIFAAARRISEKPLDALLSVHPAGSMDWNSQTAVAVGLSYGDILADARDGLFRSEATHPGSGLAFVYASKYDGTNNISYLNGLPSSAVPSTGAFNSQVLTIGARGAYLADLNNYEYFEILVFNFPLSDAYRAAVEQYLGTKYAFPDTQWAPPPPPPPVPPEGPFNPMVDSHVIYWLDASDTNTLFQDVNRTVPVTTNGQRVAAWADKSASGWNAVSTVGTLGNPTYRAKQQNGKSSVRFDGATNSLTSPASLQSPTYTVFVIARRAVEKPLGSLLSIYTEGSLDWNNQFSASVGMEYNGVLGDVRDGAYRGQITHPGSGKSFMYATKFDGTNNTVYVNGVAGASVQSKKTFSAEAITLGARGAYLTDPSSYEYFEVLVFDFALNDAYMDAVENYLGSKYALPSTQWEPPAPPPPQPPAGPYNPAADSRVVFWLDASDANTVFQDTVAATPVTANGQLVGAWKDKSASGWHVSAPSPNHRPEFRVSQQNSFSAIRFDGYSDALRTLAANLQGSGYTFFVVGKRLAERSNEAILSVHDEGVSDWNNSASAAIGLGFNGTVGDVRSGAFRSQTAHPGSGLAFMYASTFDGTSNRVFVNGTAGATAAMSADFSAETITLGARGAALENFNNYEYYEVLIFDFAMTDAYRQAVETYLASKFALPNTPYAPQPLPPPPDPVGPYTPAGDSRVILWLDAADTNTLFQDIAKSAPIGGNGQLVGAWADKSQNGWDFTVAGGDDSNKPTFLMQQLNGRPSVRTTGTADWLRTTSAALWGSNYTFFVVCRRQSDTFQEVIVSIHGSSLRDWDNNYSITLGHEHGDGLLTDVRTDVLLSPHMHPGDGVSFILSSTYNGTENVAHLNRLAGPSVASVGRFSSEVITIGSRNNNLEHPNNYDYFEILIYDFALSDGYRRAVEEYLVAKYGLQDHVTQPETSLPSNPYTPVNDSRVIFWLDGTDSTTLFQNSNGTLPVTAPGQKVGQWRDKSQKGWHVTNFGASDTKPTLVLNAPDGAPSVYFDGDRDVLRTASASLHAASYTIFVVGKRYSFVEESSLLSIYNSGMEDWNNNLSLVVGHAATDPGVWWDLRNDALLSPLPHPGNGERFVYTTKYDGNYNTVYVNGVGADPEPSFGYFSAEEIALGARNGTYAFLNGDYFEVLIYNFALSDSYRQAVETYLMSKYLIP